MPFSKALSNLANICHRLFVSSLSPQGRSVVSVWFLQTCVLPGICVWGGRWRWKFTLPCQPCGWGYGSLCSPGDTAVGRADSNLLGSPQKILCFSPGAALSELGCSRCGRVRRGGQSWKADPREASEGWHVSSGRGVRGTESNFWPHVLAAALTPHGSGTGRVGSIAGDSLMPVEPQAIARVAFLPNHFGSSLCLSSKQIEDILAHQEWLLYHLPNGCGAVGPCTSGAATAF